MLRDKEDNANVFACQLVSGEFQTKFARWCLDVLWRKIDANVRDAITNEEMKSEDYQAANKLQLYSKGSKDTGYATCMLQPVATQEAWGYRVHDRQQAGCRWSIRVIHSFRFSLSWGVLQRGAWLRKINSSKADIEHGVRKCFQIIHHTPRVVVWPLTHLSYLCTHLRKVLEWKGFAMKPDEWNLWAKYYCVGLWCQTVIIEFGYEGNMDTKWFLHNDVRGVLASTRSRLLLIT